MIRAISTIVLAVTVLVVGFAAPSQAIVFARVDRDGNGYVTKEEAYRYMNGMQDVQVKKCDRNRDGVIEPSEFPCLASIYDVMLRDDGPT